MSTFSRKARSGAGRLRRRVARRVAAPELREAERELESAREQLRIVRERLRVARKELAGYKVPRDVARVINRVRGQELTYLLKQDLRELALCTLDAETTARPGLIIEAGTARGGSAIVMAAAKAPERPMKVYDVFGMIPPPSKHDGADVHERYTKIASGEATGVGGDAYYGYRDDLYTEVKESFNRLGVPVDERNVELVQGLFEDTIDLHEPVAFAHLDGDWYESTMTCLTRIAPLLAPGGRIVLDDYYHWSGCRKAVDEYFEGRDGFRFEQRARLHVVREP